DRVGPGVVAGERVDVDADEGSVAQPRGEQADLTGAGAQLQDRAVRGVREQVGRPHRLPGGPLPRPEHPVVVVDGQRAEADGADRGHGRHGVLLRTRRTRSCARAARAALLPQAPWTPPPGWAEDEPRQRPRTGGSARPRPGTGRRASPWWR